MRRNLDQVRDILLALEASDEFNVPMSAVYVALPQYKRREIMWHVGLMEEAGLISRPLPDTDQWEYDPDTDLVRLSWKGYDFLAEAANPQFWEGAKKKAGGAFYSLSIGTLQALLSAVARQTLGLP